MYPNDGSTRVVMMYVRPIGVGVPSTPHPKSVAMRSETPPRTMSIVRAEMLTSTTASSGGDLDVLRAQPSRHLRRVALRRNGLPADEQHAHPVLLALDDRRGGAVELQLARQERDRLPRRVGEHRSARRRAAARPRP